MVETLLIYLLLGAVAGLVAGLLGVGGGIVIVPVLVFLFQAQGIAVANVMHLALGTSLATIAITSLSSVTTHHRLGSLNWQLVLWLTPGLIIGAVLGAQFADGVASASLQRFFGLFEMAVALYMFWGARVTAGKSSPIARPELVASGTVIGTISAMLGIGGGTMTVPYLTWRGRMMREAVAVSAACGFPIAVAGCIGYLVAGLDAEGLPPLATGYLYWPALIGISSASLLTASQGARLAHRLPVAQLKRLFSLILLLVGMAMLIQA